MYTLLIFWYLFVIRWGSFMIKIWSHRMTMYMKQLYCSASFLQHIYFYRWYITFGLITLICNLKYKAYIVPSGIRVGYTKLREIQCSRPNPRRVGYNFCEIIHAYHQSTGSRFPDTICKTYSKSTYTRVSAR